MGTLTYRVISIKRIRLGQEEFENRTVKKVFDTRMQVKRAKLIPILIHNNKIKVRFCKHILGKIIRK